MTMRLAPANCNTVVISSLEAMFFGCAPVPENAGLQIKDRSGIFVDNCFDRFAEMLTADAVYFGKAQPGVGEFRADTTVAENVLANFFYRVFGAKPRPSSEF